MKFLSLAILLFSLNTNAFTPYSDKECEKNNVITVNVSVSADTFEPRIIYLKENDKVCLKVKAIDYNVAFTIDKHPIYVSVRSNKESYTYFKVGKKGEYKITCKGGCALGVDAKLVVQSKEEYDKWEEEKYREQSDKYRKKYQDAPVQDKALTDEEKYLIEKLRERKRRGY